MSALQQTLLSTIAAAVIVAILMLTISTDKQQQVQVASSSPTGSTFNSAKFAGIVMAPATGTATSTSVQNTDSNDRYVISTRVGCEGLGTSLTAYTGAALASLTLTVATSSTQAPATLTPTFRVALITIATSSPVFSLATSTTGVGGAVTTGTATNTMASVWPAGSWMTFATNATNTAVCTVGVDYIGS